MDFGDNFWVHILVKWYEIHSGYNPASITPWTSEGFHYSIFVFYPIGISCQGWGKFLDLWCSDYWAISLLQNYLLCTPSMQTLPQLLTITSQEVITHYPQTSLYFNACSIIIIITASVWTLGFYIPNKYIIGWTKIIYIGKQKI